MQAEFPRQVLSRNPALALSQEVGDPKPFDQGEFCAVQTSACGHRLLEVAAGTHEYTGLNFDLISLVAAAFPAPAAI